MDKIDYKGFDIKVDKFSTVVERNGWTLKPFHLKTKEEGLKLSKSFIDDIINKYGKDIMEIPIYQLVGESEYF